MRSQLFKKSVFFSLFIWIFLPVTLIAQRPLLRLPSIFSDHMVLQRGSEPAIWGIAQPGKLVSVSGSWNPAKKIAVIADRQGHWRLKLPTQKAGGPYVVTISAGSTVIQLKDVMLGDVWLCSGQSNMEIPVKGYPGQPTLNSNMVILQSTNPQIRLFTVKRNGSTSIQYDCLGDWQQAGPASVADFSATGYYFGRLLQQMLKVPIGLINCSYGGSNIEAWMDSATLADFSQVVIADKDTVNSPNRKPTQLFNGMLSPLIGIGLRGCIWYQGENNTDRPSFYARELQAMVGLWRRRWAIGSFPFYYAQIAPYDYGNQKNSAFLREAQYKAQAMIENAAMAVLLDVGDARTIHPFDKQTPGTRLALLALDQTYGMQGFGSKSPVLKNVVYKDSTATLSFDHIPNGITSFGETPHLFEIAGADHKFYSAIAKVRTKSILLYSPYVKQPVAVRYAFHNYVKGEIFNTEGLPLSSFRTDDWPE